MVAKFVISTLPRLELVPGKYDMIRRFNISNALFISILAHLFLWILVLFTFDSKYGTTDDLEMEMILSGRNMLLEPSYFLRYTHIFIGYALYQLYQWTDQIPWYGIYLLSTAILGLSAILYASLKLAKNFNGILFHIIVLWSFALFFLVNPQFTSSALLVHFGAIAILYLGLIQPTLKKRYLIIYVVMSLVGAMMRIETFYLASVLSIPLLLSTTQFSLKQISKVGLILLITWIMASSINAWHYKIQNNDKDWLAYNEYNELLAGQQILDYKHPAYQWNESTADDFFYRIGWTYEDYMLFKQWFMADSDIYDVESFKAMHYSFSDCGYEPSYIIDKLYDLIIGFEFNDYVYSCMLIFLIILIYSKIDRKQKLMLCSTILLIGSIICYLFTTRHIPERVLLPIGFYLLVVASLVRQVPKVEIETNNRIYNIVAAIMIGLSLPSIKQAIFQQHNIADQRKEATIWVDSLAQIDSNITLVGIPSFLFHPYTDPFKWGTDSVIKDFRFLDVGHHANSPNHQRMLDQMMIDDMHQHLVSSDSAYFIHRSDNTLIPWYINYLYRKYDIYCSANPYISIPSLNVTLYKIRQNTSYH